MATEIERKFLVSGTGWMARITASHQIRQAYLARSASGVIRVRIVDNILAFLTVKSTKCEAVRSEFEYAIPLSDGEDLIKLCSGFVLEKVRHRVLTGALTWEVDVFEGPHRGLVIAEIELQDLQMPFVRPDWLGTEVTGDARYYNAELARGMAPLTPGLRGSGSFLVPADLPESERESSTSS